MVRTTQPYPPAGTYDLPVDLTVLGACGSWPGPGEACSGYLVESGGTRVVVDLGSGALANLQRHVDIASIDAVVVSHEHPDHWVDLTGLATGLRYGRNATGVPLYATPGTLQAAEAVLGGLAPPFSARELANADTITVGGLGLRFATTDHGVPTLAVRIDDTRGASMAYSADTGPDWSFRALGDGIDVALCEASYTDSNHVVGPRHLTARQAGAMTRDAGIPRLIITHLTPGTDPQRAAREAAEAFGADVEVATAGATFAVP